ncbi:ArsR family transcriptional regulator [Halosimplex sp. TS25]|uniref:DUF7344 domain-containing protein n=1 Tax=Halosimplex rarum TaxID=3396619 RepID=UPI0039EAC900
MCEVGETQTDSGRESGTDEEHYAASLSVDAVLSLLADHQRRDLLRHLIDSNEQTASLDECVRHLLQREQTRFGECPGHEQIETALHHIHMPKLEEAGILEYDSRSRQYRYRGHDQLEAWLERIEDGESDADS